jgi:hypothetical protein
MKNPAIEKMKRKKERDMLWIKDTPCDVRDEGMRDLLKAYQAGFARKKKTEKSFIYIPGRENMPFRRALSSVLRTTVLRRGHMPSSDV